MSINERLQKGRFNDNLYQIRFTPAWLSELPQTLVDSRLRGNDITRFYMADLDLVLFMYLSFS